MMRLGELEAIKKKLPSGTRTGKTTSDRSPIHSLKLGWPNLAAKRFWMKAVDSNWRANEDIVEW